ncbi:MAG: enoyl-CoA hydratase/isomerase family protein [Acidimicrobiales bacterium]|nr:enoyl-CoA hydratase/isomerase family protein [Acidimicrobiales bacterium]
MSDKVTLSFSDSGVATVTISNPPLNIYDLEMRDGLIEAFSAVRDNPDVRAFLLRSGGDHFSAGADLSEFGSASSISEARRIRWERDPWLPLLSLPVPTMASLRGYAMGSGLEMALLCDLRIAATDTVMGLPETKLGMLPAAGGTQSLSQVIGHDKALPLILTGSEIHAADALNLGLITNLVEPAELENVAGATADQLARIDPLVASRLRRCMAASRDLPLEIGLELERRLARSS